MNRVIEEMPVERSVVFPFGELAELATHEEGLLTWPGPLQGQQTAEIRRLRGVVATPHLADERALTMHDLVMRKRLHEGFGPLVKHAERELVVVEFSEERILTEVVERVVHPAHVPLEVEAQAAFGDGLRHAREGCGFLGNHRDAGLVEMHQRVHLFEEFNRLDVLASAIAIRNPFPRLAGVVEVEHRSYRVDAQAIDVETLEPGKGGAD